MARSLDEIIEHEKPEVIQQAHEKAKEIIKDIDEKADDGVGTKNFHM
ncbi:hypothetical protein ACLIM2_002954 [Vibrio cholerae]